MKQTVEIGVYEAKTHFSQLLENVKRGAVFSITQRGTPVAESGLPATAGNRPHFGMDKGRVVVGDDFNALVPGVENYMP